MSKTQIDLSLTTIQLSTLIDTQEKREADQAMQGLKTLAEYDSSPSMNEQLTYRQSILVALAYNKPELLKDSYIKTAADAIRCLDRASLEMLHIWFSCRDRFLIYKVSENKELEVK